jgi:phosphohistidine phosphatase
LFNVDWQLNTMRYLILLRHGESADKQHGQTDFERILTVRGIDSIRRLATHLTNEKLIPDYAIVSPAVRTKQTTQILFDALDLKLELHFELDVYNGDDFAYKGLLESISGDRKCILLVGHNPSISALVGRLAQKTFVGLYPGQAVILTFDNKITQCALLKTLGPFM